MAEIHSQQAQAKLLRAQSLLLSLGEVEVAKALQKVVDRLGGDSPAHALADDLPATASIAIKVLADGRVRMSSTCGGRPDSLYAPLDDQRAPQEVRRLLGELRERVSLQPSTEVAHG